MVVANRWLKTEDFETEPNGDLVSHKTKTRKMLKCSGELGGAAKSGDNSLQDFSLQANHFTIVISSHCNNWSLVSLVLTAKTALVKTSL